MLPERLNQLIDIVNGSPREKWSLDIGDAMAAIEELTDYVQHLRSALETYCTGSFGCNACKYLGKVHKSDGRVVNEVMTILGIK